MKFFGRFFSSKSVQLIKVRGFIGARVSPYPPYVLALYLFFAKEAIAYMPSKNGKLTIKIRDIG